MAASNTNVPLLYQTLGPQLATYRETLGKFANAIAVQMYWDPRSPYKDPYFGTAAKFFDYYKPNNQRPIAYHTAGGAAKKIERESINGIDAICLGASEGMKLAINVAAMLIAFTAVVAATNWLLGQLVGPLGWHTTKPLQEVLGYLNAPFAWIIGIPSKDCVAIGQILGERIVLNEFFGYITLSEKKALLDPRSYVLATYALCGFANLASVAIQIGGIGALAPIRRPDLVQLGLKAMFGGLLACYMTACVAGVLL
jgi:CNT family concentrative nucleoside transporter